MALRDTPVTTSRLRLLPGASLEAAIAGAAHEVLSYLFPVQQALFDSVLSTSLSHVADGAS